MVDFGNYFNVVFSIIGVFTSSSDLEKFRQITEVFWSFYAFHPKPVFNNICFSPAQTWNDYLGRWNFDIQVWCDPLRGCYKELFPDGSSCSIEGSTCSVAFICDNGQCVCNGILHSKSTHVSLIVGLGVGLPIIGFTLILLGYWIYWRETAMSRYTKLQ